jgi:hypothetical protein
VYDTNLSWWHTFIKFSQAISHVQWLTHHQGYDTITLMNGTMMVPETENFNHLTWLMAQEDFIKTFQQ